MEGLPAENVGKETTSETGEDRKEHVKQASKQRTTLERILKGRESRTAK